MNEVAADAGKCDQTAVGTVGTCSMSGNSEVEVVEWPVDKPIPHMLDVGGQPGGCHAECPSFDQGANKGGYWDIHQVGDLIKIREVAHV